MGKALRFGGLSPALLWCGWVSVKWACQYLPRRAAVETRGGRVWGALSTMLARSGAASVTSTPVPAVTTFAPSLPLLLEPWETWPAGCLFRDILCTPAHPSHWALRLPHQVGFWLVPLVNNVTTVLLRRLDTLVICDHAFSLPPISMVSPKPIETVSENACNVAHVMWANLYTKLLGTFGHPLFVWWTFQCLQRSRPCRMMKEKTKPCVRKKSTRKYARMFSIDF